MRVNLGALLLFVVGVLFGWWLSDRPLNQLDNAIRLKANELDRTVNISIPVLVLIIFLVVFFYPKSP